MPFRAPEVPHWLDLASRERARPLGIMRMVNNIMRSVFVVTGQQFAALLPWFGAHAWNTVPPNKIAIEAVNQQVS